MPIVKSLGQRARYLVWYGSCRALALAFCAGIAWAEEPASSPQSKARDLAAEVLRGAGNDGLGEWTRSIVERALERAGEAALETAGTPSREEPAHRTSAAPLPAERHAARAARGIAGRPDSAELLVFMSLSVPAASWAQWAHEVAYIDAPLVLRGVGPEGFRATVKEVGIRLGGAEAGVAIDPRLFRLFAVDRVPAVVVVSGGIAACASRGCAEDPAPPHDLVTGNVGLVAALETIAAEGDAGRQAARQLLERLNGEEGP